MKRTTKQLIILIVVVAVLAGGYFGLRAWNASQEEAQKQVEADAAIYMSTLGDITEISFEYVGQSMTFEKADGTWTYAADADFPLDTSYLTSIESSLASLKAVRSFENAEGDEAYGLDSPEVWVTAKTSGGDEVKIDIGDATGDYYYARLEGSDLVYTVQASFVNSLSHSLVELATPDTIPTLTEESIETVTLRSESGTLNLRKSSEVRQEETQTDTGGVDDDGNPLYETTTEDVTVYIWEEETADGWVTLPGEGATLSDFVDELTALSFSECYNYKANDEDLAACGLSEPKYTLAIGYDEGEVVLYIGDTDSIGDYYAQMEGSGQIDMIAYTGVSTLFSEGLANNLTLEEAVETDGSSYLY